MYLNKKSKKNAQLNVKSGSANRCPQISSDIVDVLVEG